MKYEINKKWKKNILVMGSAFIMMLSSFNVAFAQESSGQLTRPCEVIANDQVVAYVSDEEAGRQVLTGLRVHYYDSVTAQMEANIAPLVTIEKVTGTMPEGTYIMDVKSAVKHIVELNKDEGAPIKVAYSDTLKEIKAIKPKKKVVQTTKLEKGEKKVVKKGEEGKKYVVSEITQVNSEVVDKDVMKSMVTKKPTTEIVYQGTTITSKNKGKAVVAYAKKWLGNPYVWGGEDLRNGIDCSGFTMKCYEHFGISLPHSSSAQGGCGKEVSIKDMQAGDLIVYDGHVAMYMGDGRIIHAAGEKVGIIISDDYNYSNIVTIRRIFGTDTDNSTNNDFPSIKTIEKGYNSDSGLED